MVSVRELFAHEAKPKEEGGLGIPIFSPKDDVSFEPLPEKDEREVKKVFDYGVRHLELISPRIADIVREQWPVVKKVAAIFKTMLPEKKPYKAPSEAGSLGVTWLWPGAIRYAATPSDTAPCYTSYPANSWTLDLTAGTPVYFFGSDTNYYKASPTTGKHSMILVFKDGVLEIGSTPKLQTFRVEAEGKTKYGIYSVAPVVEERVDPNRNIYLYPTLMGATMVFYDVGIKWAAMPLETGKSTIKLLGLVFYEHELYPDLASTYIT